ncbi:glycoside hydrolase family 3 protein [Phenylobacterium deserti]|uniref:Glycoside hydrolase family 3 protein n=2 Tax=Phenylobacterium deserti TaxID=1914756 RepID=A0A328AEC7_9CAUL|nr:glycoside hydrolase family 3 protein [Phenylobacterium deserti]
MFSMLVSLSASGQAMAQATQPLPAAVANLPYRNTQLSVEQRAADLVRRMTLEEKAHQVGHTAPAIPRLGVPQYNWWNEGLHGVARAGFATVFPQAIGMAASWDAPLMQKVGDVVSTEFRAKYVERLHPDGGAEFYRGLTVWSPNINIFRDPRWGRGQETYGEDPHLTSQIGISYIRGLQGSNPNGFKTIATSKHFAVHSGPESNRHKEDVHPSAFDLEDTYLPAFRATVIDGKVQSVMCVYNAVYGVPGCASSLLMTDYLRTAWNFPGYVVSDCGAAANIFRPDSLHYTKTAEEGVAVGFKAGMDLICGDYRNNMSTEPEHIEAAVKSGLLPQAVLDQALQRLFEARIRLGMFDPPGSGPYGQITAAQNNTPEHAAVSLQMAKASMTLLKNDGLLPFKGAPRRIAVIGPNADSVDALIGNYYGTPTNPVTVLAGLKARFPNAEIVHVEGTGLVGPASAPVPDAAFCVDAACTTKGLKQETFGNVKLEGAAEARTSANAAFDWTGDRESSARWTGYITAPETGEYRFRFASDNGYRVFIDNKPVVEEWGVGDAPSILDGGVRLEAGKRYPIRVEGFQRGVKGRQRLIWSLPSNNGDDAVAAARNADVVVFVGGLSARVEGEEMKLEVPGFAGGDRTSLDLPAPQQQLLQRVHATGKPTVLVLMNGSALSVNWADANVPAIVEAWYPGQEGGHAVAQLLAGDYSPAGRLPVTFYKSADQLPAFSDYKMAGRTYRYFNGEVLYPFGHGLSYTKFSYANPKVSSARVAAGQPVTVSVNVTNNGAIDGDEVVQLYTTHPGKAGAAVRSLHGFQRVSLKKGETRTVQFTLDERALSTVDEKGVRRIDPGQVQIWVGGGQPVARQGLAQAPGVRTQFQLTGSKTLPK